MNDSRKLKHIKTRPITALIGVAVLVSGLLVAAAHRAQAVDILITAEVEGDVEAVIQWAVPELRVGETIFVPGAEPETNDDADFYLTVRTSDNNDDVILFTQSTTATTDVDGTYLTPIELTGITAGTYDVGIKTQAHLTKVLDDVSLVNGTNTLNFSTTDNSAPKGSEVLLGGDISNAGTSVATLGDDVVNSVDISTLLTVLNDSDPTGNAIRANINQDDIVNSVDLSIILKNLDVEGDN